MEKTKSRGAGGLARTALVLALWTITIWLIFPLFTLNSADSITQGQYILRSFLGIGIMIILFGKTGKRFSTRSSSFSTAWPCSRGSSSW